LAEALVNDRSPLCSGVTFGTLVSTQLYLRDGMAKLSDMCSGVSMQGAREWGRVVAELADAHSVKSLLAGIDQGIHNLLLHRQDPDAITKWLRYAASGENIAPELFKVRWTFR
jgi:hypothetical protein